MQLLGGDRSGWRRQPPRQLSAGAQDRLNFGCPAPTVNRHDGGATLLRSPRRIREIVGAVRAAVPASVPVSAKLRLGWDSLDPIHENAEMAAAGRSIVADYSCAHPRAGLRAAGVLGSTIGEVRRRLSLPIVANGDIWTVDDLRRCRDITGCEHFMLGRGALADPWLARKAPRSLASSRQARLPLGRMPRSGRWLIGSRTAAVRGDWFLDVLGTVFASRGNRYTAMRLKQWLRVASVRRVASWLELVKRAETTEDVLDILQQAARDESRTAAGAGALVFTG